MTFLIDNALSPVVAAGPIQAVRHPARRPASTSEAKSPTIHEEARSMSSSSAARSSSPALGLRHAHRNDSPSMVPSGWWGQT